MKIIASINQKGGVGKTTSTIHIGAYLAKKNRVLLIDFDPQMNLSQGYKIAEDYPYTVLNFLKGDSGFRITEKLNNLYIMSGHRDLDSKTYSRELMKQRLKQLNDAIQDKFDYIIIDCPPQPLVDKKDSRDVSIPVLNEIALVASDYIIIPLEADEYSVNGLSNFIPGILRVKKLFNPKLSIAGVFFNKVIKTEKSFKDWRDALESSPVSEYLLEHYIRKDKTIQRGVFEGKSVFQVDPKCRAAEDYRHVCNDIIAKMN